nr:hypothetical protein [Paracoccus sp. (in: a-proteobacteria)]
MSSHPSRSAFVATDDDYCDRIMQTLLLDGRPPAALSIRRMGLRLDRIAWRNAGEVVAARGMNPALGAVKRVSIALRHKRFLRHLQDSGTDLLFLWRGDAGRRAVAALAAESAGVTRVFFERGSLPGWVQIDCKGVNARGSIPRDPRFFQAWRQTFGPINDWRGLTHTLKARAPLRKLVGQAARSDWDDEGPFLFCPFQLNQRGDRLSDAGWVTDPADLVAALA